MSEFKDFLDQIKVRLTNPLLFSFLISWMVIHWQIFVGAFYLSHNDLIALGHSNFLDFVKANIDWSNGFVWPLGYALLYTVASPLLRIGVQYLNTSLNKWGNNHIRKVAKDGFIQYEMYDLLLEEVKGQRNRYEEIVRYNNQLKIKSDELEAKNEHLTVLNNNLSLEKAKLNLQLNSIFDSSIIHGKWRLKVINDRISIDNKSVVILDEHIQIKNGQIFVLNDIESPYLKSFIRNFMFDMNEHISFIEEIINMEKEAVYLKEYDTFKLKLNLISDLKKTGNNNYEGFYNKNFKILMDRIL